MTDLEINPTWNALDVTFYKFKFDEANLIEPCFHGLEAFLVVNIDLFIIILGNQNQILHYWASHFRIDQKALQ